MLNCPGPDPLLAPGPHQLAVGRILVNAGIAIAIGDEQVPVGRERGVGAAVERLVAHERRRGAGHAERHQHLAFQRAASDGVAAVVGEVERLVRADMDAVGARIFSLTPGPQEIALAVEDDHRVLAAVEHIDLVLAVDRYGRDIAKLPSVGQLRPVLDDPITVLAAAQNCRHEALSSFLRQGRLSFACTAAASKRCTPHGDGRTNRASGAGRAPSPFVRSTSSRSWRLCRYPGMAGVSMPGGSPDATGGRYGAPGGQCPGAGRVPRTTDERLWQSPSRA